MIDVLKAELEPKIIKNDMIMMSLDHYCNHSKYLGWMEIDIKTEFTSVKIYLSSVFDPFYDFVWWMKDILNDFLPIRWEIDEEGRYKKLFVYAVNQSNVRFIVVDENTQSMCCHKRWNDEVVILDTIIPKEVFIKAFYLGFKYFVKNEFVMDKWEESNLHLLLERLDERFEKRYWDGVHTHS